MFTFAKAKGNLSLVEQLMSQKDDDLREFVSRHHGEIDPVTARGPNGETLLERAARAPEHMHDRTILLLRSLGAFSRPLPDDVKFSLICHIMAIESLDTGTESGASGSGTGGNPAPPPLSFFESVFTELNVPIDEWVTAAVFPMRHATVVSAPLLIPHCNQQQLLDVFHGAPVELLALVIAHDPSIVNAEYDGQFPLDMVDTEEKVAALLAAGASPTQVSTDPARPSFAPTPLHDCIENQTVPIVKLMLAAASNPNVTAGTAPTPFTLACQSPNAGALVPLFIEAGVDPNARDRRGKTVLEQLVLGSVSPDLDFSIFDMSALCSTGDPIILYQVKRAHQTGCPLPSLSGLLQYGADPNMCDPNDCSPLEYAVDTVQDGTLLGALVQQCGDRIDLNQPFQRTGLTALQTLVSSREPAEKVRYLLQSGRADATVVNGDGATPLMLAASYDNWVCAVLIMNLLERSPEPDALRRAVTQTDNNGRTVLHHVASCSPGHDSSSWKAKVVKRILQVPGYDVNVRDKQGLTAAEIARSVSPDTDLFDEVGNGDGDRPPPATADDAASQVSEPVAKPFGFGFHVGGSSLASSAPSSKPFTSFATPNTNTTAAPAPLSTAQATVPSRQSFPVFAAPAAPIATSAMTAPASATSTNPFASFGSQPGKTAAVDSAAPAPNTFGSSIPAGVSEPATNPFASFATPAFAAPSIATPTTAAASSEPAPPSVAPTANPFATLGSSAPTCESAKNSVSTGPPARSEGAAEAPATNPFASFATPTTTTSNDPPSTTLGSAAPVRESVDSSNRTVKEAPAPVTNPFASFAAPNTNTAVVAAPARSWKQAQDWRDHTFPDSDSMGTAAARARQDPHAHLLCLCVPFPVVPRDVSLHIVRRIPAAAVQPMTEPWLDDADGRYLLQSDCFVHTAAVPLSELRHVPGAYIRTLLASVTLRHSLTPASIDVLARARSLRSVTVTESVGAHLETIFATIAEHCPFVTAIVFEKMGELVLTAEAAAALRRCENISEIEASHCVPVSGALERLLDGDEGVDSSSVICRLQRLTLSPFTATRETMQALCDKALELRTLDVTWRSEPAGTPPGQWLPAVTLPALTRLLLSRFRITHDFPALVAAHLPALKLLHLDSVEFTPESEIEALVEGAFSPATNGTHSESDRECRARYPCLKSLHFSNSTFLSPPVVAAFGSRSPALTSVLFRSVTVGAPHIRGLLAAASSPRFEVSCWLTEFWLQVPTRIDPAVQQLREKRKAIFIKGSVVDEATELSQEIPQVAPESAGISSPQTKPLTFRFSANDV